MVMVIAIASAAAEFYTGELIAINDLTAIGMVFKQLSPI